MNLNREQAAKRTREVVIDMDCSWTEAAAKVLENARLSADDCGYLLALGLGQYARASLNRRSFQGSGARATTPEELLEPLEGFLALTRVFQVGETHKRFIDCDATDLGLIAEHLQRQRDGLARSSAFVLDVKAECERFSCRVAELPTLKLLEERAPW